MTNCYDEGRLRAYLDGELPPEDRERVSELKKLDMALFLTILLQFERCSCFPNSL